MMTLQLSLVAFVWEVGGPWKGGGGQMFYFLTEHGTSIYWRDEEPRFEIKEL